jgi:hypothetical protein
MLSFTDVALRVHHKAAFVFWSTLALVRDLSLCAFSAALRAGRCLEAKTFRWMANLQNPDYANVKL